MIEHLGKFWRVGRHNSRIIYAMLGPESSRDDVMIGFMDTAELAEAVVSEHNKLLE